MKPWFQIYNAGTTAIPLSDLTIRYWFTINVEKTMVFNCDYAFLGCANLTGTYTKLPTAKTNADYYLEVSFKASAGNLAAGGNSGEIQTRLNKSDYTNMTQTDDYSFDGTKSSFALWDHVTVYNKGVLVYGVEPP